MVLWFSLVVYETQISEIIPWTSIPSTHPVEIEPFTINNEQYLAVVNFRDQYENYNTKSAIYKLNQTGSIDIIQEFPTSGAVDFEYVEAGLQRYAIFLDYVGSMRAGGPLTHLRSFQLNQYIPEHREKNPFHYRSRVKTLGAKQVKVFMKVHNFYLNLNFRIKQCGGDYFWRYCITFNADSTKTHSSGVTF